MNACVGDGLEHIMTTFSEVPTTKWSKASRMQVDTNPGDLEHTYEVVQSTKLS